MLIFRMIDLLRSDPQAFFLLLLGIVVSLGVAITVHEFSHALVAYRLGDNTARMMGRLSLNPLVHLDPAGTLMLFLVGFGWGKPVPVNPYFFRSGARKGMAMVGVAGPIANIVTAGIFALPIKLGMISGYSPFLQLELGYILGGVIGLVILYNVILAIFNLIPVFPLDGFNVALGILPRDLARAYDSVKQYGPMVLIFVIAMDMFLGTEILWRVLRPPIDFLTTLFAGSSSF